MRRLNNDQRFIQLYKIATNPSAYSNANRFSKLLQESIDRGFPVDYKLSADFLNKLYLDDPNAVYYLDSATLLHIMMSCGRGEVNQMTDALLQCCADPNITNDKGENALILAAKYARSSVIISKLLRKTKDVNHISRNNLTAFGEMCKRFPHLHSSYQEAIKRIKLLLDAGADPDIDGTLSNLKTTLESGDTNKKCLIEYIENYLMRKEHDSELTNKEWECSYDYEL